MMTYKGAPPTMGPSSGGGGLRDQRMYTHKGAPALEDVRMMTSRPVEGGLKQWERDLVDSQEVKRKATVAQLCEYRPITSWQGLQGRDGRTTWLGELANVGADHRSTFVSSFCTCSQPRT